MTTPRCGLLFHFTHVDNLPEVLNAGALLSDTLVCARDLLSNEAGDREIKAAAQGTARQLPAWWGRRRLRALLFRSTLTHDV